MIVAYFHATFAPFRGIGEREYFLNPSEAESENKENQLESPANFGKNPAQPLPKPCKKIKIFRSCVLVAYLRATFAPFRGIGERGFFNNSPGQSEFAAAASAGQTEKIPCYHQK